MKKHLKSLAHYIKSIEDKLTWKTFFVVWLFILSLPLLAHIKKLTYSSFEYAYAVDCYEYTLGKNKTTGRTIWRSEWSNVYFQDNFTTYCANRGTKILALVSETYPKESVPISFVGLYSETSVVVVFIASVFWLAYFYAQKYF